MPPSPISKAIENLRRAMLRHDGAGLTDGQLLGRFVEQRDNDAFAALVRRHSSMVWSVCRRILRNRHDAEDAFQATFLVLLRRAAVVVPREMLPNWLYGVAHQTALKARSMAAKRNRRERQVADMPEPAAPELALEHDLRPLLDQELSRLPDKYRVLVVLCDLEGKTRREAARQLGIPEGTVAGRLARARTMLAKRLTRRGLVLSAGAMAAELTQHAATAAVPTVVVSATIQAAASIAAGQAVNGLISTNVATLMKGVLNTMLLSKLKIATALLFAVSVVAIGVGHCLHPAQAGMSQSSAEPIFLKNAEAQAALPATKPVMGQLIESVVWCLVDVDSKNNTINDAFAVGDISRGPGFRIAFPKEGRAVPFLNVNQAASIRKVPVAQDAEVWIDGRRSKLSDLKSGDGTTLATLQLSKDNKAVSRIDARTENDYFVIDTVNIPNNTVSLRRGIAREPAIKDIPVPKDGIFIGGNGDKGKITDLVAGMRITFELGTENGEIVLKEIWAKAQ